jgi:hypothetical protein
VGGFNSGSERRSHRLRSDDLHRISLAEIARVIDLKETPKHVGPCGPYVSEIEIAALTNGSHVFRRLVGYRTGWLVNNQRGVPPARWASTDSLFVELTTTPGRFGGLRLWFVCPRQTCRRRCTVLYRERRTNARAFTCRHCLAFRYETQLLGKSDLVSRRIDRLVSRLAVQPDGGLRRPKRMHRRTFQRIADQSHRAIGSWKAIDPTYRHFTKLNEDLEQRARAEFAKAVSQNRAT